MTKKEILKTIGMILLAVVLIIAGIAALFNISMSIKDKEEEERSEIPEAVPVLTYHRIINDEAYDQLTSQKSLWVKESVFKEEMSYLHKNGYTTLSMEELYDWHENGASIPDKSVVLTFDDGHYSIVRYGLPVLKKYGMKATMFMIGKDYCFKGDPDKLMSTVGLEDMVNISEEYPDFCFQSHTYAIHRNSNTDPVLPKMKYDEILKDFKYQDTLFAAFKFDCIAYPYGYYNDNLIKAAGESGFKMGFTYGDPVYATKQDNVMLLPRIGVRGDLSIEEAFYKWLNYEE